MHAAMLALLFSAMVEHSGALVQWYQPAIPGSHDALYDVYKHVNYRINAAAVGYLQGTLQARLRLDAQRLVRVTCPGSLGDCVVGETISNAGAFSQVFALYPSALASSHSRSSSPVRWGRYLSTRSPRTDSVPPILSGRKSARRSPPRSARGTRGGDPASSVGGVGSTPRGAPELLVVKQADVRDVAGMF